MKVISYSLWGNNPRYIEPLIENITKAKELFPGWIVYVYISNSLTISAQDKLASLGAVLIKCGESPDTRGAFWRFKAFALKGAEIVIIRDSDSELTLRDKLMVDHWLETRYDFYLCRDHPWHQRPLICCCWGARGLAIKDLKDIANYEPGYSNYGDDEKFLAKWVYLRFRREFLVFAEFLTYNGENLSKVNIPRISSSDYIGRVKLEDNTDADRILEEYVTSKCFKVRYLIPYSFAWRIVRRMLVILRIRKDDWREFNDFRP